MVEVEINASFGQVASLCAQYIGERKYYLHRSAGGVGWEIRVSPNGTWARFEDDSIATFIILKLSR